jgi:hydroxyacylglutathione hydrolase
MIFRHIYHRELAQASYLVGCAVTGEALVIDPNRDIDQYIKLAEAEGLRTYLGLNITLKTNTVAAN